jgi:4-amino-4-deoxy-L-arabinose transferase-like glycosyltransferase
MRMLARLATDYVWVAMVAILAIYAFLGIARVLSTHPWNDESWYTTPAINLILHGHTGTSYLETTQRFFVGLNERTYWVAPLHFFVQAAWLKVFGIGLMSARVHALFWGAVALLAWGGIAYRLTGARVIALLTMFLLACEYQFVSQSALARMDAMAVAFASLGILAYLYFRERNLMLAVLLSQAGVAACGVTHPTPGVPALAAVVALSLYYDWRRIRVPHVLVAALPYLIGAAAWGWYISLAPEYFRAQFFGNVEDMDRLSGLQNPLLAITREYIRYAGMAGLGPGQHPLYKIKVVTILVYVISVAVLLIDSRTRRDPVIRPLLLLWGVYALTLAVYENTKATMYGFSLVPFYVALTAIAVARWWTRGGAWQAAAAACVVLLTVVGSGGLLYTSVIKNDYHRIYLPLAEFIRTEANPNDTIFASSEFGFALGHDSKIVDDLFLGYYSRKSPDLIVLNPKQEQSLGKNGWVDAAPHEYVKNLLDRHFTRVYSRGGYAVYRRNGRDRS